MTHDIWDLTHLLAFTEDNDCTAKKATLERKRGARGPHLGDTDHLVASLFSTSAQNFLTIYSSLHIPFKSVSLCV